MVGVESALPPRGSSVDSGARHATQQLPRRAACARVTVHPFQGPCGGGLGGPGPGTQPRLLPPSTARPSGVGPTSCSTLLAHLAPWQDRTATGALCDIRCDFRENPVSVDSACSSGETLGLFLGELSTPGVGRGQRPSTLGQVPSPAHLQGSWAEGRWPVGTSSFRTWGGGISGGGRSSEISVEVIQCLGVGKKVCEKAGRSQQITVSEKSSETVLLAAPSAFSRWGD